MPRLKARSFPSVHDVPPGSTLRLAGFERVSRDGPMSTEQRQDETWTTDDPITNHADGDLPDDIDFFVAPPEEIGHVTSAYSTLRLSKQPWPPNVRVLLILAGAALGIGL